MLAWAANSGGGGKVRPSCMSASIVAASATSLTLVLLSPLLTTLQLRRHVPVSTSTLPPRRGYCQQEDLLRRGHKSSGGAQAGFAAHPRVRPLLIAVQDGQVVDKDRPPGEAACGDEATCRHRLVGAPGYAIASAVYCFDPVPGMVFGGVQGGLQGMGARCTERACE